MSRHQYDDDLDQWVLIRWRGAVTSAIRGVRGQALLRDMLAGLDALPHQRLIVEALETPEGEVCALGAVGQQRGMHLGAIDPEDPEAVATAFDIAEALAREVAYVNDDRHETPEERWTRVRAWVVENLR